jgi:hypothetical protein
MALNKYIKYISMWVVSIMVYAIGLWGGVVAFLLKLWKDYPESYIFILLMTLFLDSLSGLWLGANFSLLLVMYVVSYLVDTLAMSKKNLALQAFALVMTFVGTLSLFSLLHLSFVPSSRLLSQIVSFIIVVVFFEKLYPKNF